MPVPEFHQYYPSIEEMNPDQQEFYRLVETKLSRGEYIDVEGNISYVFLFVYSLIFHWNRAGFGPLFDYLTYLSELYRNEPKISDACLLWASDCLLGLGRFDLYLQRTEPDSILIGRTRWSNIRVNVQKQLCVEPDPFDLLLLAGGRRSKFLESNIGLYKDKIRHVFQSYADERGGWSNLIDGWNFDRTLTPLFLFGGVPFTTFNPARPTTALKIADYSKAQEGIETIKHLAKEAESLARAELGLPQVGEGWFSETDLFRRIKSEFSVTTVIQHGRPAWLGRQHFDIWIPNWKVAIEYHGKQHFQPVAFFGGEPGFENTVRRDQRKRELSSVHGIKLIIVIEDYDFEQLVLEIHDAIRNRVRTPPSV